MKNNIPMKNTFSRATAHLRLNVSTITAQLRSIYGYTILLFSFLTLGFGQAWGASTVNGGYIYFDELNSGYTGAGDMQFWIGHSKYSCAYSMSKISNTKLWYCEASSWGDASYFAFTSSANWPCESNDYYSRITTQTWKSGKKESYTLNSGSYYVFKAASTANKAAVSSDSPYGHQGNAYSSLNKSQTFKAQVSADGGNTYSNPATAPATISFSSKTFSNANTCGTSSTGSFTAGGSTVSLSRNAGFTATTELTYSSLSSGYTFVCWHDGSSSVGTETSYTYYPTGTNTITARFTKNFTVGDKIYLLTNTTWKNASELNHYAAYFYGAEGNTWVDCERVGTSDYYYVTVPSGNWGYVIFVALNSATNEWSNKIYQTNDLMYDSSHNGVEITGNDKSQDRISVYTVLSVTRNNNSYAAAPSITNSQTVVKSGSSITVNAGTETTGYHWVNWTSNKGSFGTATNKSTTFTPTASSAVATANYAINTQTVRFSGEGNTGGSMSNQVYTYGVAQALTSNAFTKTGYNFGGWATSSAEAETKTVAHTDGASITLNPATHGTYYDLYAIWNAKQCAINFDFDATDPGHGSHTSATTSTTATYAAAMLSVTPPTAADGWAFMGYFDAADGEGTQYYTSTGASARAWDKNTVSPTTLYAYYKKAQITNLSFDAAVVAPSASVGVTPTVAPTPAGTNSICWKLLYSNGNLYEPQPNFVPNPGDVGNKVTFDAPGTSGMYLVAAVLRTGNECNGGTKLDSVTYPFQVAGDHTVTVQYKCGSEVIAPSTTVTGKPLEWTEVVAHDIFGYYFSGWTTGDGVTIEEAASGRLAELQAVDASIVAVIKMKAIYDGKLTANYSKRDYIYFKSTALGWNDVYVYFYTDDGYWDENNGAGATGGACIGKGKMELVPGETDIYYWDYGAHIEGGASAATKYVAFTWGDCTLHTHFNGKSSCYPMNGNNQGFSSGTPMFVPITQNENYRKNNNATPYYDRGYWTQYIGGTGYSIDIFHANGTYDKSINFEEGDSEGMPFTANVYLNGGSNLYFKVHRSSGMYYYSTTNVTMSNAATAKPLTYDSEVSHKTTISTNVAGDYLFSLTCASDGNLNVTVKYPAKSGDYRLVYSDGVQTKPLVSDVVPQENGGKDTVSFFVRPGSTPVLKIQQASVSAGVLSWGDYSTISPSVEGLAATGVYNICLTMDGSGAISVENVEPYTGEFYIRTDAANNKWDNYRAADHLMTYSEYSKDHSDYTHYFVKFVSEGKNVKFVVANDYSPCISDTLIRQTYRGGDSYHVDENGFLNSALPGDGANVRYMWDIRNNAVYRAYLAPAQKNGSKFLVLRSNSSEDLRDEYDVALTGDSEDSPGNSHGGGANCMQFVDNENWIYEATVMVRPSAYVKLYGYFHDKNFYFKGSNEDGDPFDADHAIQLVTGSTGSRVKVRVIYDFKTDRLVAAYLPSGNIDEKMAINADVMFIREHQGDIDQLTFSEKDSKMGAITDIKTAYAVMRFNKWTLNNKDKNTHEVLDNPKSIYERSLYYVSFPFHVKLSEVFGFGTYGQHWIIQRYRGDLRAQQGYWAESAGFWEFIWNRNGEVYLEPNQGYILTLETELLGVESDVWGPESVADQVELYFPSSGSVTSITNSSVTQTLPAHTCTINRAETEGLPDTGIPATSYNRTIFDSHWNIMSVPTYFNVNNPTFANTTWIGGGEGNVGPKFLYTWNPDDNTLTATSGTGFMYHAMHAYTVQYYGNVTWTTSVTPSAAPQRNTEYRGEYEFCLEVQQDEQMIDRTFVRLSDDENVTTGFEFGEDMTKQFNSRKANIFTIAGNTSLGGNSLPLSTTQTTVVPVGVSIKSAGDYTFSIPEGTEGIGVTLVDNETGTRTSLSALDYTVTLQAGDYTGRFVLEISPIQNTPTGLEEPTSDSSLKGRAQKVMIDGILYIVKDGKIFDARGARVE